MRPYWRCCDNGYKRPERTHHSQPFLIDNKVKYLIGIHFVPPDESINRRAHPAHSDGYRGLIARPRHRRLA